MMRRSIFAWLFGGAAAGQTVSWFDPPLPEYLKDPNYLRWRFGPALNGQCPVCGTMAEAWIAEFVTRYDHYQALPGTSYAVEGIEPRRVPLFGTGTRAVVCAHCSNLFQQRAEEEP